MTISTEIREQAYNTGPSSFAIPFKIDTASELFVVHLASASPVRTVLVLNVDYTVNPALNQITLINPGNWATGTFTLYGAKQFLQLLDYLDGDDFPADVHEKGLDTLTMLIQQVLSRAVKVDLTTGKISGRVLYTPAAEGDIDMELPSKALRAGAILAFDSNGKPTVSLSAATPPDHGALPGLLDDDHTQYYNQARGDARYSQLGHNHDASYSQLGHTHAAGDIVSGTMATARLGAGVANDTVFLRGDQTWAAPPGGGGVTDHGALTGLGDDDHAQYHNDARGDARYPRKTANEVITGSWQFNVQSNALTYLIIGEQTTLRGAFQDSRLSLWAEHSGAIQGLFFSMDGITLSVTEQNVGALYWVFDLNRVQFNGTIELGHASDTTLSRLSAGVLGVEGVAVSMAGHTHDHGTLTGLGDNDHPQYPLSGAGATISGAWNFTVAQQFSTIELGHATDTTLSRVAAGRVAVEGVELGTRRLLPSSETSGVLTNVSAGRSVRMTAGCTINNSVFADGDMITFINTTDGALTITQGSGVTLRVGATTGNVSVPAREIRTCTFVSASEAYFA